MARKCASCTCSCSPEVRILVVPPNLLVTLSIVLTVLALLLRTFRIWKRRLPPARDGNARELCFESVTFAAGYGPTIHVACAVQVGEVFGLVVSNAFSNDINCARCLEFLLYPTGTGTRYTPSSTTERLAENIDARRWVV